MLPWKRLLILTFAPKMRNEMHSIRLKDRHTFQPRFLTFPTNKIHMSMPVQVGSHLRDISAIIICTSGCAG